MIKLNEEKFLAEINKKWSNKLCPMCGGNNWSVEKTIVTALKVNENGSVALGGDIMPLVSVTCLNCGNILFVNPLVVNALDQQKEEK